MNLSFSDEDTTDSEMEIADIYIKNYLMPDDLEGDAIHLAYASVYKIDFLSYKKGNRQKKSARI